MKTIEILIGVSGSGKSTYSKNKVKENSNLVRINRDDLRKTLFAVDQVDTEYYDRKDLRACEKLVSEVSEQIIYDSLNRGSDVIIDNTNLQMKYIQEIIRKFNHLATIELNIMHGRTHEEFNLFEDRLIDRYQKQDNIGEKVSYLTRQWKDFIKLKEQLHGHQLYLPQTSPQVSFNKELPKAYLFDIDGNLAKKGDRDIFDDSKLHLDTEIIPVGETLRALHSQGYKIIFLSGRQDSCRKTTKKWLEDNNLWTTDSEMFMRKSKDQRCDSIVKEELLIKYVVPKYNVLAVFDDRIRVVKSWERLGLFCFNTNQGYVKF